MENEDDNIGELDMDLDSLKINSSRKRGLSRYYSGKARSFSSLSAARCVEDLKKVEPDAKRRKKYHHRDRKDDPQIPSVPCQRMSSELHGGSSFWHLRLDNQHKPNIDLLTP